MPKIVRVGEFKDYTLIENACLRDKALDIAERGLLVTMLSLPDNWDFNGVGLSSILPCGKSKVYSTLNKLEAAGYLKRSRVYENGKVSDWEYHICGRPIFKDGKSEDIGSENNDENKNSYKNVDKSVDNYVDNHTDTLQTAADNFSDNGGNSANNTVSSKNLFPENQEIGFQKIENQKIENLKQEKPDNNKIYNNKILNNQVCINQSINQSNSIRKKSDGQNPILPQDKITGSKAVTDRIDGLIDKHTENYKQKQQEQEKLSEDYKAYKELIKANICFNDLCISVKLSDRELLDDIVNIMADVVSFNKNPLIINNCEIPAEIVKSRFLKITYGEIEYILEQFSKTTAKINNIRKYLITMIYNAKSTINSYYKAEIQHDFYGYD